MANSVNVQFTPATPPIASPRGKDALLDAQFTPPATGGAQTLVGTSDVPPEDPATISCGGPQLRHAEAIPNEPPPYPQIQDDLKKMLAAATKFAETHTYDDTDISALIALAQSAFMKEAKLMRQMAKLKTWAMQGEAMASAQKASSEMLQEAAANQKHEQAAGMQGIVSGGLQVAGGAAAMRQVVQSGRLARNAGKASEEAGQLRTKHADGSEEFSAQHERLSAGRPNKDEKAAMDLQTSQHKGVQRSRADRDEAEQQVDRHKAHVKNAVKAHRDTLDAFKKDAAAIGDEAAMTKHDAAFVAHRNAITDARKNLAKAQRILDQRSERHEELQSTVGQKHIDDKITEGRTNLRSLKEQHESKTQEAAHLEREADLKAKLSHATSTLAQGLGGAAGGVIQTSGSQYVLEAGQHSAAAKIEQARQEIANMDANLAKDAADAAFQLFQGALQTQGTIEQDQQRLRGDIASRV